MGAHGSVEREGALAYLRQYHYLGCNRPAFALPGPGRRATGCGRASGGCCGVAVCAAGSGYIGWSATERVAGLHRIGNHSRFLILPWVRVPHLASHLLGGLVQRICADWPQQHGWELELLETFVETGRFRGVAYRAANWQEVGQTTGRTRQEKQHRAQAPRKSVWVHPLGQRFREHLGALGSGGGAS